MAFCRGIPSHEKNPPEYPEDKNPEKISNQGDKKPKLRKISDPGDLEFSGFSTRDLWWFSRGFQTQIPIPGISGFSGLFDLAQIKKYHLEANSE